MTQEDRTRTAVIACARKYIGVKEVGRNAGHMVGKFLASVGLNPGHAWCAAFVFYVLKESGLGHLGPKRGKARVANWAAWAKEQGRIIGPDLVKRGDLFFWLNEDGTGHIGFVEAIRGETMTTVEGNTNDAGSREGDGVYGKSRSLRHGIKFIRLWNS